MGRNVAIVIQNFDNIIENNCFYIDKSYFIKEWWDSKDSVTLITRPRCFGKALTMSMVECFFSLKYAGRKDLFDELSIWENEEYHGYQKASAKSIFQYSNTNSPSITITLNFLSSADSCISAGI